MAWIAKEMGPEATILDAETGEPLATCFRKPDEPSDFAWSRACVMSMAPELHRALADMVIHAKRHLPEVLLPEVKAAENLLNRVKELYDRRDNTQNFRRI